MTADWHLQSGCRGILPIGRGTACPVLMSYSMGSSHNLILPKGVGPLAQSPEGCLGRIELVEEGSPLSFDVGIDRSRSVGSFESGLELGLQMTEKLFQDRDCCLNFARRWRTHASS